jgi:excisionase family DNA binding protein
VSENRKLSTAEAAVYTGFTEHQVRRAAREGRLAHYSAGKTGPFFFGQEDLDEWLDAMFVPAAGNE